MMERKAELRRSIRSLLSELKAEAILAQSEEVSAKVVATVAWERCRGVALFCSMEKEFQTLPLLKAAFAAEKKVFLPKVLSLKSRSMVFRRASSLDEVLAFPKSKWGIPEPPEGEEDLDAIDLVIVPGLAFDYRCARLGQGAGFYDTFFDRLERHKGSLPPLIGVALDQQILPPEEIIPTEPHDRFLDELFSPSHHFHKKTSSQKN